MIMGVSPAVATTLAVFFMGINRSEWMLLFSGLLGAVPAAVISAAVAAWVAVTVLGRTNEHQRKLAAEAAAEQRDTALKQMAVQQKVAVEQLAEQRTLAEQQLAEQRTEAARAREQAALADVIAAVERFPTDRFESMEDLRGLQVELESAVARWRVEVGRDSSMQEELLRWTTLMFGVAVTNRKKRNSGADDADEVWALLGNAASHFSTLALAWASSDGPHRVTLKEWSGKARLDLETTFEGIRGR